MVKHYNHSAWTLSFVGLDGKLHKNQLSFCKVDMVDAKAAGWGIFLKLKISRKQGKREVNHRKCGN
jgi:hypothetical protein